MSNTGAPPLSPAFRIVLLCIGAAMLYGLIMDQITARVCVEYFTVAHPRVMESESPTLLALYWGVAASWWVGLMLGIPLALAARAGSWPQLGPRDLIRPLVILLIVMACGTLAAGITGYQMALSGRVPSSTWKLNIREEINPGFTADAFAHLAAYVLGFFGGVVLTVSTALRRKKRAAVVTRPGL